jgi:hypothetical protein
LDFWLLCRKISLSGAEIAAHVSVKEDELMRTDDCEIRILICCHLEEDHFWKFYSSKSNSPELECNTIASAKELSGTRLLAHRLIKQNQLYWNFYEMHFVTQKKIESTKNGNETIFSYQLICILKR